MNDALKVGDRVRIIADCPNKNSGIIISIGNDAAPYCVKDNDGLTWWHDAECLQKITSEEPAMQKNCMHDAGYRCPSCSTYTVKSNEEAGLTELKLEVGKKYTNPTAASGCLIYLGSKNAYGFNDRSFNYIFIDSSGDVTVKTREQLEGIKEHREPYKISWDEYAYVCEKHLSAPSFSTYLTSPLCDCARKIFCEITIKEKEQNAN